MAMSDYITRGGGTITPVAMLAQGITPLQDQLTLTRQVSFTSTTLTVGASAMIGNEIARVVAFDDDFVYVDRGCADTIPQPHPEGRLVWFFDDAVGTDGREYVANETIGVKVLMKAGPRQMPVDSAPPNELQFVGRFIRPYPPGKVQVNGLPWFTAVRLDDFASPLVLSWAHRDRVVQGDVLFGHAVGSIGPEPGTSYVLEVRDQGNTVVRSIAGIAGTGLAYSLVDAMSDLGLVLGNTADVAGKLMLYSVRDGHVSYQRYEINFVANIGAIAVGWGNSWGMGWGA